jgi:pyruvate-formate lyase-activating enzyme
VSRPLTKTIQIINDISPSMCAAKWYNATIWLGNGRTASCHLPPAHSIPLDNLVDNPSALHNTEYKKQKRLEMLNGSRPDECAYCWTIEDQADKNIFSDRVYKSHIYQESEIFDIEKIGLNNVDPKTLEISFDNLCNLSCSYCNAEFSSTWASDIKINGPFVNLKTTGGGAFQNDGEHSMPYGIKNENNPYIEAFFRWFHLSLKNNLQELRVTGGEPSRSPWFWKLLEECKETNFDFAVNSNLMMDRIKLTQLIDASEKFKKFDLYTSGEGYGNHGEFVRWGLDYRLWRDNLERFANEGHYRMIHIMMTISALSIWSITEFMSDILELRKKFGGHQFHMSLNIVRFPSFQNLNTLSDNLKLSQADKIENWLKKFSKELSVSENNQIQRIILYLRDVDRSQEDTDSKEDKQNDLKNFTKQYASRRKINLSSVFPNDFITWLNSI